MVMTVHPSLVERVVFERVRGCAAQADEYHAEFAACHETAGPDARERAFRALHQRWFDRLGLRRWIDRLMDEFPRVRDAASQGALVGTDGPRQAGMNLYGAPGRYAILASIDPRLMADEAAFEYFMRHELSHLDDMLDPEFGYDLSMRPDGPTSAARSRAADRYAVLWALSVDARLSRREHAPVEARRRRYGEFVRAFGLEMEDAARSAFDRHWNEWGDVRPRHDELMARARSGFSELVAAGETT
jgi:hypothetical protein